MRHLEIFLLSCLLIFLVNGLAAEEEKSDKNTIENKVTIVDETAITLEENLSVVEEKFDPEIDKFLNIEDTSIFIGNFKSFDLLQIHSRSRDYYLLIKNIHDLHVLLTSTNNNGDDITNLIARTKANLKEARSLIDEVNSFVSNDKRRVTDFLTESQKQFYRDLVAHYNEINKTLEGNK